MRKILTAMNLLIFFNIYDSAFAQATAIYGGSPYQLTIMLPVTAYVNSLCSFSTPPQADIDVGDIAAGFSHDIPLTPVCNTPFRVAVSSLNGGLQAADAAPSGYSRLAAYNVTLSLYSDIETAAVSASCTAQQLAANAPDNCNFRGPADGASGLRAGGASALARGSHLRLSAPAIPGMTNLIASRQYHDTITVTISASL